MRTRLNKVRRVLKARVFRGLTRRASTAGNLDQLPYGRDRGLAGAGSVAVIDRDTGDADERVSAVNER